MREHPPHSYDDEGFELALCEVCGQPGDTVTMDDGFTICSNCLNAGDDLMAEGENSEEVEDEFNDIEWDGD